LANISGITIIHFSYNILSASEVVGPLANSKTMFALILSAFFSTIWFSNAAGIRMSQSCSRISQLFIFSASIYSVTDFLYNFNKIILSINIPFSLYIHHFESEIQTSIAHKLHNNLAIVNQAFHAH
jgi:hypothetical protein